MAARARWSGRASERWHGAARRTHLPEQSVEGIARWRGSLPSAGGAIPDPCACRTVVAGRAGVPLDGAARRRWTVAVPSAGGASRMRWLASSFDGRFRERSECDGGRDAKKQQEGFRSAGIYKPR